MGGADNHDQVGLQRNSIQKCVSFRKYYKQLFLGLVDMAIFNGVIVHRIMQEQRRKKAMTHAVYMRRLHSELLCLRELQFEHNMQAEDLVTVPLP